MRKITPTVMQNPIIRTPDNCRNIDTTTDDNGAAIHVILSVLCTHYSYCNCRCQSTKKMRWKMYFIILSLTAMTVSTNIIIGTTAPDNKNKASNEHSYEKRPPHRPQQIWRILPIAHVLIVRCFFNWGCWQKITNKSNNRQGKQVIRWRLCCNSWHTAPSCYLLMA